jgi:Galactose oxidase, central domain
MAFHQTHRHFYPTIRYTSMYSRVRVLKSSRSRRLYSWNLLHGSSRFFKPTTSTPIFDLCAIANSRIHSKWDNFGPPDSSSTINSVSWGGGVGISELGQGYMLGGWLSNASVSGWSGGPIATSTLIKYEMDSGVWTNNTGPDDVPRAEGVMVYLPASNSGLLIYFGGVTAPYNNDTIVESPMSTIYVYDIASGKWYTQTATGDVPLSRRRFCAGAAWSADRSSYNM